MKIKIASIWEACNVVVKDDLPEDALIVSIRSTKKDNISDIDNCSYEVLKLIVEDISFPVPGSIKPSKRLIKKIVDVAGKALIDDRFVLVHCHAGVSRSSATALIAYHAAFKDMEKTLEIFDPKLHCPNKLMLKIAQDDFGMTGLIEAVEEKFKKWRDKIREDSLKNLKFLQ